MRYLIIFLTIVTIQAQVKDCGKDKIYNYDTYTCEIYQEPKLNDNWKEFYGAPYWTEEKVKKKFKVAQK